MTYDPLTATCKTDQKKNQTVEDHFLLKLPCVVRKRTHTHTHTHTLRTDCSTWTTKRLVNISARNFWATVCKTVRPLLSDRCLSCLSCLSVTLVYCGQTVGWIKMPLATEVDLGPGDIVIDGDPAALTK